jgi:hypothetical protein
MFKSGGRWRDEDMARAEEFVRTTDYSVATISAMTNVPRSTIQSRIQKNGWTRPAGAEADTRTPPSLIKARQVFQVRCAEKRRELYDKAWDLAGMHMDTSHHLFGDATRDIVVREREARILSTNVGTLAKLQTLETNAASAEAALQPSDGSDHEPREARTPAEIREEFARHLEATFGGRDAG